MTDVDTTELGAGQPARGARAGRRAADVFVWVLPFALALLVYLAAFDHIRAQGPTGDEPSYVLDGISMARDGDRDLSNQVDAATLNHLFGGLYGPHAQRRTSAGLISWHGAGVGALIVPGVWVGDAFGDTLLWIRLELIVVDALTMLALFAVLRRIGSALGITPLLVWIAWGSVAFSLPVVAFADQAYPEIPALLCILLAVLVVLRRGTSIPLLIGGSVAASALPWLHVRYIPVCFGLLAALALRGLTAIRPVPRDRLLPTRAELAALWAAARSRAGARVFLAVALPAIASFAFMAYEFDKWYGSPSWLATSSGPGAPQRSFPAAYSLVVGGLLSPDFGWLPFAPVFVLGLAGIACLWVLAPRWTTYGIALVAGYQLVLAFSGIYTPGFTFPGRYELICLPFAAIPLLVVLARVPAAWVGFVPLALLSLALTFNAAGHSGYVLLNTGTVDLPLAQHLQSAWPDTEQPAFATSFMASQSTQQRQIGHLRRRSRAVPGRIATAAPSAGSGFLSFGPGIDLAPGAYVARFSLARTGGPSFGPLGYIEAWGPTTGTLAKDVVTASDLPPDGRFRVFVMPFSTPGSVGVQTRIFTLGRSTMRAADIHVALSALGGQYAVDAGDRFPKLAQSTAWLFGIVFTGALLLGAMRGRPPLRRRGAR